MKKVLELILSVIIIPLLFLSVAPLGILNEYPWITYLLLSLCVLALIVINNPFKWKLRDNKYEIEAMPRLSHPIRGREKEYNHLASILAKRSESKLILVEGEFGIGKTTLVSSYILENKKNYDLIIWQPLSDIPTTREIVNFWLNIYSESIPELSLSARINAFIHQINENNHKNILIIFDNIESILKNNSNNRIEFSDDFLLLLKRLINISEINLKIVLTTAVDLESILSPEFSLELIKLEKLQEITLQKIICDRISQEVALDNISAACGNPSAALLLAGIAGEEQMISKLTEHNEKQSLMPLVDKRFEMLSINEQLLVLFLCIIRFPLSLTEIQHWWYLIPPYGALDSNALNKLHQVYVVDTLANNKIIINPIVAEIIANRITDDLANILVGNYIDDLSLVHNFPIDYARFSDKLRANTKSHIFPDICKKVKKKYSMDISKINIKRIINNLLYNKSKREHDFLPSNVVTFLLFLEKNLSNLIFPIIKLYGVDFSRSHMFNTDLSNVQLVDCFFADRNGSAYATCFLGNNSLLVGLASGSVELRNITDLQRIRRIEAHSQPVRAVYYSSKYKYILSAGEDGRLVIYNDSLEIIKSFDMHSCWIWRIVPITESCVISVACDKTIGLINLETATICKIPIPSQRIWDAAILNDEIYLVTEEGIIWKQLVSNILKQDIYEWLLVTSVTTPIKACCVCSNTLVFGCRDHTLYKLDSQNKNILISRESGCIRDLCAIPDSNQVISVGDSGIAYIHDISENTCIGEIKVQSSRTWQVDICGSMAVTVGDDRTIHLWDINELSSIRISSGNGQSLRSVDVLDGYYRYACADDFLRFSDGDIIYPWISMGSRKRILGFVGLEDKRWACTFDNGEIAFGYGNTVRDIKKVHESAIESIARNLEGNLFATGGEDRVIKVFDSDGKNMPSPRSLHSSRIWSLGFSPNNEMLGSAGGDFIVAIWKVKDGQLIANCVGHNNLILSICWLDNERIVSAGTDGTIRLWEARSGRPLSIKAISGLIRGLATDGNCIYGTGRVTELAMGWFVLKWDITTDTIYTNVLPISGGSARTIIFDNNKLMIGGDIPFWVRICPETLNIISKQRIPGIYSGLKIKQENLKNTDFESLRLLGADMV